MWVFDVSTYLWTWTSGPNTPNDVGDYGAIGVAAASNNPPSRAFSAFWADRDSNEVSVWLFGGQKDSAPSQFYNDLWRYRLNDSTWTWMGGNNTYNAPGSVGELRQASTTNIPRASAHLQDWSDSLGNVWIYGGNANGSTLNSFWYLRKYVQCEEFVNQARQVATGLESAQVTLV